jgi:hypothetical protein
VEYFDILIEGSSAAYQRLDALGLVEYLDADGNTVPAPDEPVHYILRTWCVNRPAWMEPLPPEP